MHRKTTLSATTLAALLAFFAGAAAQEQDRPSARDIVHKATTLARADDERIVSEMKIIDAQGARERKLEVLLKAAGDEDDMILVRFTEPANMRGTALLTIEHAGGQDDQWLYLPALRKTKRIASGDKSGSFAGTDFTYEDIRTEDLGRNRYELLGETTVDERACWVVAAEPNDPEASAYSRRIFKIAKDEHLILRVDFFDKAGQHAKALRVGAYRKVSGLWRAHAVEMRDLLHGSRTAWRALEREINAGIDDSEFSQRALER